MPGAGDASDLRHLQRFAEFSVRMRVKVRVGFFPPTPPCTEKAQLPKIERNVERNLRDNVLSQDYDVVS
jgi:hypothetical protein